MGNNIHFVRLTTSDSPVYAAAMRLYEESFPLFEKRTPDAQREIMGCAAYQFLLIYDGDRFVGLLSCWEADTFIYVEHFCIDPQLRGQRYGQRALELLHSKGKPVILEIDPPVDSISIRRKGFYERLGYRENPFPHMQLRYRKGSGDHQMAVMSYPKQLTQDEYAAFHDFLHTAVMGVDDTII